VDHYSTDKTLDIAKKYKAKIIFENVSLGYARQLGIENVSTEYFLFVDSDVIIKGNKWLEKAYDYFYSFDDLAAIVLDMQSSYIEAEKLKMFWGKFGRVNTNFYCIVTLIRTDSVREIKIPRAINSGEDKYIGDWLVKNGWKYRLLKTEECYHFVDYSDKKSQWSGAGDRIYYGLKILPNIFIKLLASPIRGILPALAFRDIKIFISNEKYLINYLRGFLHHPKYNLIKRKAEENKR
jgi:glycosyltransferase involved in cell wall biosynthesis